MSNLKIKVISRNPEDYLRATKRDIHKSKFNIDLYYITTIKSDNINYCKKVVLYNFYKMYYILT